MHTVNGWCGCGMVYRFPKAGNYVPPVCITGELPNGRSLIGIGCHRYGWQHKVIVIGWLWSGEEWEYYFTAVKNKSSTEGTPTLRCQMQDGWYSYWIWHLTCIKAGVSYQDFKCCNTRWRWMSWVCWMACHNRAVMLPIPNMPRGLMSHFVSETTQPAPLVPIWVTENASETTKVMP